MTARAANPGCEAPTDIGVEDAGPRRQGGEVKIRIESEPGTLLSMYSPNPVVAYVADHSILEALVFMDPGECKPEPLLAKGWAVDEEAAKFTFDLNGDALWHDGVPVTSADVVFTFEQLLDPGGKAIRRQSFLDVKAVTPTGDKTVEFELDEYRPDFLEDLSRVSILPAHVFGKNLVASHAAARAPVGTGPFVFGSWKSGTEIVLKRNPSYRGVPAVLDRIVYKVVPERRVALDMFSSGDLDIVTNAGRVDLAKHPRSRVHSYPLHRFEAWTYNTRRPFFKDSRVRQAMGALVDRRILQRSVLGCQADIVDNPWPPGTRRKPSKAYTLFSTVKARALLDSAGWMDLDGDGVREKGGVPLSFTLLLPDTGRELKRTATVVQHDMSKAGVRMNMKIVGWGVYTDRLRRHEFDVSVLTVPNRRPFDPANLFHSRGAKTGTNFGLFHDGEVDRILDELAGTKDPPKQDELRESLEDRLAQTHPLTLTFRPRRQLLYREGLQGVRILDEWLMERSLWWSTTGGSK